MRHVTLHKKEAVFIEQSSDLGMDVLGECLAHDVRHSGAQSWIDWIKDERYRDTTSNLTFMEKEDGNIVLGSLFDQNPYERALTIPIPIMVNLLEQWDAVCKTNLTEVTVYYENGKFRVESLHNRRKGE